MANRRYIVSYTSNPPGQLVGGGHGYFRLDVAIAEAKRVAAAHPYIVTVRDIGEKCSACHGKGSWTAINRSGWNTARSERVTCLYCGGSGRQDASDVEFTFRGSVQS